MKRMITVSLCALFTLLCLSPWKAGAYLIDDLNNLFDTNSCTNCDLSGVFLGGMPLPNINVSEANLTGAVLATTNLSGSNFSGANLTKAFLVFANLSGANLTGANLTGAQLDQADLSQAIWTDGSTCGAGSKGQCNKAQSAAAASRNKAHTASGTVNDGDTRLPDAGRAPTDDPLDNWVMRSPSLTGHELKAVAYGASTYVAVGDHGIILTSAD
jgi:hypothetical protein